ncbi:flagellar hook-associated protein 2 [Anaerotignum neopropionicum]|uniref:Flagellar hook-associated protein 2 n=1 Tax=Anaerotignum neopropionicum TaxID=36847 RepID=A0A136WJE1_9FIRM|nr:flagellar filament capping protein FliD [Anaerotignum neopropionicum]KXL54563.1 flagellar hook-associated protein 2 [Anaerotignum neopropionicum]
MATINSLTSTSSSSNAYGSQSKAIGGLVSGLDTDTLIDGMTIATRSKIAKQKQSKTLLSWKTDAYRAISDKLVSFAQKYTSYTSSTNLTSESFYKKSVVSATGTNNKYVSVSGTAATGERLSLLGVKQLAKDASFTTTDTLSNNIIKTGAINYGDSDSCTITGKNLTVKYGSESYTLTMPEKEGGGVYTSAAEVAEGLTKAMEGVELSNGKKLSEVMSVTANGETLSFKNIDGVGNGLEITGGNADLMKILGITSGSSSLVNKSITDEGVDAVAAIDAEDLHANVSFAEKMKGKSLTFEYNGTKKTITFDDETKLDESKFMEYIQDELNSAFGKGRIQLTQDGEKRIQFETTVPGGGVDQSSILYITSGSTGVMGDGSVLGIRNGSSNKVNLDSTLAESGIKDVASVNLENGTEYEITINGESIKFTYEENKTTLRTIMSAINANEKAGVKISYQANSDSFSITSTQKGASGSVEIGKNGVLTDFEKLLFGKRNDDGTISNTINGNTVDGQDAIILVDFDGEGGAEAMEISRGTNSFSLNGLNIAVNGTFGYEKDELNELQYVEGTEAVKFDASVDTDKIVTAIKSMIDDYNELVEASNSAITEKRNRTYAPLTDEQKADMSESEIASWEEKAKSGMLYGDSDVTSLTNDLRYIFMNMGSNGFSLSDIGITVSSNWQENGKISLDETKLKSALAEDADSVKALFTEASTEGKLTTGGIMTRMKALTDKYAATTGATKGILVEKAGNSKSPTSLLSNRLQKQMDDIDKIISRLEDKLKTERTRYQKQFTQLETLMQKLNSQSSWLYDYSS